MGGGIGFPGGMCKDWLVAGRRGGAGYLALPGPARSCPARAARHIRSARYPAHNRSDHQDPVVAGERQPM